MFDTNYNFTVTERFLRYVQIDTQSNLHSITKPSTQKQTVLSQILAKELQQMGLQQVETDDYGYVYATIPANTTKNVPVICFCSHIDTSPDCSGENIKPIIHKAYNGSPITLPDDKEQIISIEKYPYLATHIGKDIITASGLTLLGADDKSGIAVIMDFANYLLQHPHIKHGTIRLLFTPDEEVGRGTENLNMQKLNADFGYTLDGAEAGDLEDESFSADGVVITVFGVSAHPGYAKNKMVNALKLCGEILDSLPKLEWSPETTTGKQGFVHPVYFNGVAEKASIEFIVRDFKTPQLSVFEARLKTIVEKIIAKYSGASFDFEVKEQYRNMKEVLDQHSQVVEFAKQAIKKSGLQVKMESIRGGTDGSRLSFMGLPCPNLFTGMQGIHSKTEWIGIADMQKSVETLVNLAEIWETNS